MLPSYLLTNFPSPKPWQSHYHCHHPQQRLCLLQFKQLHCHPICQLTSIPTHIASANAHAIILSNSAYVFVSTKNQPTPLPSDLPTKLHTPHTSPLPTPMPSSYPTALMSLSPTNIQPTPLPSNLPTNFPPTKPCHCQSHCHHSQQRLCL